MMRRKILNEAKNYAVMCIACASFALAAAFFFNNTSIVAGGFSGVAILLNSLFGNIPIGLITIAMNLPFLIIGIRFLGLRFVLRSALTITVLGVFMEVFSFLPPLTTDPLLAALYGGVCQGFGVGLFIRYGFSSGGTELLSWLITRFIKPLRIPLCVGILDGIIVLMGAIFTQNPSNLLYALIVIFVSTKVSEFILVGIEKSKLCFIITDKGEEISHALMQKSPRGITMLNGQGMYTHDAHSVLMTNVKNRQLSELKETVKQIDGNAFVIVSESVEVRGKGFLPLNENKNQ